MKIDTGDSFFLAEQEASRLLENGVLNEEQGRLEESLKCYNAAISLTPNLGRAHFYRGNVLLEMGAAKEALEAYEKALELKPDSAAAQYNKGNAYMHLACQDQAVDCYQKAIELKPDFADAEVSLGVALEALDRFEAAEASYRRALVLKPEYAEVYYNLAGVLRRLGRLDEAVANYRQAMVFKANYTDAFRNLAAVLRASGRLDESIESYRRVLIESPGDIGILSDMGEILRDLGKFQEAESVYRQALDIQKDDTGLLNDLGILLHQAGNFTDAVNIYQRALEIEPENSHILSNFAAALQILGRFDEAILAYQKAVAIAPDYFVALANLGGILGDVGRLEEAVAIFRRVLDLQPGYTVAISNLLFTHNYSDREPPEQLLAEAQRYGKIVANKAIRGKTWNTSPEPERCLRIGLVSGDFRDHAAGYFVEGVLTALASKGAGRLRFLAYSESSVMDSISQRIKANCSSWLLTAGLSDEVLVETIRNDGVDILIDLSGHTGHNRLPVFAWKPAPVQASWLGYFATTGVKEIDYLIADPWTLPESEEKYFTETIWRLPETRLCFTPPDMDVPVLAPPAFANRCITFGCFNNLAKMGDEVIALWAQVLKSVPNSRLLLKAKPLRESSTRERVLTLFAAHGVGAERLIFEIHAPRKDYLAAYNRVDIALDPFPYPGGATTVEALWMGVPVLTLAGDRFLSRQGVGLLMNAGLPDWVAKDKDDCKRSIDDGIDADD